MGALNALDIDDAEEYWLKFAQSGLPQKMQRGNFKTLTPYADENGIIRVGSRVDPSLLSYDNTRPVLLPCKHWISMLVTRQAHHCMVIQVLLPPQQNAGGSIGLSEVTMCPGLSSVNAPSVENLKQRLRPS